MTINDLIEDITNKGLKSKSRTEKANCIIALIFVRDSVLNIESSYNKSQSSILKISESLR